MKAKILVVVVLLLSGSANAAQAATYEEGLRYKREQRLPEAAAAFADVLKREPRNTQALEQLATVQAWQNHYDDSIGTWRRLLALAPNQTSAHIGLARVRYWKGERTAALSEVDAALKLAPHDADALVLKGDILLADGQPAAAHAAYLQAQTLRGANADSDLELSTKIAATAPAKQWRLDAGVIGDRYSNMRGNENESYAQLGYAVAPATTLYLRLERLDNFGAIDHGISGGGYFRLAPWLLLNAEAGGTPDHADFRPQASGLINAEFLLAGWAQPLLGLRYLKYSGGGVTTVTPGVRLLASLGSLELRYGFTDNLDGSKTGVFQARAGLERENYAPYIAFASGQEALPPQAKADVQVIGAGSVFTLSPAWGARVDFTHENRKNTYTHNALGLGLSYRF